ncbi:hypothetical protein COV18_03765 [Candidatus Woesearchaeota archaeon CG10_big_fil_rev_8_21_14_0_10_37_12]|nr:MAG: hypothetical protein COV18_03765 [Candidatus Woesearchaeota archaeon CG10_big_fil_rev_8_21_14_0_10_37_12]
MYGEFNYLAVLIAAIVSIALGMIWYAQPVFGKLWLKLNGYTTKDAKKMKKECSGKTYIAAIIAALVTAAVLELAMNYINAVTFANGLYVGFFVWLGFAAPIMLGSVLWEQKPVKAYLLNVAFYLVNLLIISGILAAW